MMDLTDSQVAKLMTTGKSLGVLIKRELNTAPNTPAATVMVPVHERHTPPSESGSKCSSTRGEKRREGTKEGREGKCRKERHKKHG